MNILELRDVVKQYQTKTAVDHISVDIPKATIFGLLGPNGAGKTSLIRIITNITKADSGEVFFDGQKLRPEHSSMIGYMPEERGLYKKMKVGEQLMYLSRLKGLSEAESKSQIEYWFEKLEIKDWWNKKIEELSKGMQQKVQFIATVLHKPKLLILDEPFSGLDPINANLIKDEIFNLHKEGTTVIFSTHRMEQVEEICDNIVLINQGKAVLNGSVKEIKNTYKEHLYKIEFEDNNGTLPDLPAEIRHQNGNEVIIKINEGYASNQILSSFINNGYQVRSFNEILPTINEIFIKKVEETK